MIIPCEGFELEVCLMQAQAPVSVVQGSRSRPRSFVARNSRQTPR